jgi:hypothetical protein
MLAIDTCLKCIINFYFIFFLKKKKKKNLLPMTGQGVVAATPFGHNHPHSLYIYILNNISEPYETCVTFR